MSDVMDFPADRDRFTRWVRNAMANFERTKAAEGQFLHPMAKKGLEKRLAELGRDADGEFGDRTVQINTPAAFHQLPEADRLAISAAVGEALSAEGERAFMWYGLRYMLLAVELEEERIKRHTGR